MKRDVYTTQLTADAIIGELNLDRNSRVADLGCGDGVFLIAAASVLASRSAQDPDRLTKLLFGIDVEPERVSQARRRLDRAFGKPSSGWDVRCGDALDIDDNRTYDFVVGNPPWIRLHHIPANTRNKLRARFQAARGMFDLCYLFVEKALEILNETGQLAMVVPRGIEVKPSAVPLRELLSRHGHWSVTDLPDDSFRTQANIRPALLILRKRGLSTPTRLVSTCQSLGDLAHITSGVPTGANRVFLVPQDVMDKWHFEEWRLKPVVRGRSLSVNSLDHIDGLKLIWPYRNEHGRWVLDNLADSPRTLSYLVSKCHELLTRPRLRKFVRSHPDHWYRFIDPNRHQPDSSTRFAIAEVFDGPKFCQVRDPGAVVLNSCFQVLPKPGCECKVLEVFRSHNFWSTLIARSRHLANGYYRTSVSELRSTPC